MPKLGKISLKANLKAFILTVNKINCSDFFLFLCNRNFQQITWLGLREKKKESVPLRKKRKRPQMVYGTSVRIVKKYYTALIL